MKLTGMSAFSTVNWNLPNLNPFPDETSFSCKLRLMSAFSTVLENAWSSIKEIMNVVHDSHLPIKVFFSNCQKL